MRSKWYQAILFAATAAAIPVQVFAHPGHEGHGMPVPAAPVSGQDCLTAMVIVTGLLCARALLRKVLRSRH